MAAGRAEEGVKSSGPPTPPPQLHAVVEALKARYHPERVILFGSHAWGTPREDSDVDLLIVKETDARPFDRCYEVRKLIRREKRGMPVDILVYTPAELEERLAVGDPFIGLILRRGVVLHAA